MAITYAVATNIITVTGFTEAVPCNFTDLYNADKAGTLSLHARVGIAAVDGAAVAVDRAERPTDYVILGGASNDLYITISNWVGMVNATIQIVGTDRDGAAQTENIAVNAAGNWPTTMWFRTIVSTQVTVFNGPGGSFDYDLTQGQWGVVWLQGTDQFQIDCKIDVGDGVIETWFADTMKQVLMYDSATANADNIISVADNATFRLGELVDADDKITRQGCAVFNRFSHWNVHLIRTTGTTDGVTLLYSSAFCDITNRRAYLRLQQADSRLWNCSAFRRIDVAMLAGNCYNWYTTNNGSLAFTTPTAVAVMDRIMATNVIYLFGFASGTGDGLMSNVVAEDLYGALFLGYINSNFDLYFVDCDLPRWDISISGVRTGRGIRQYTFNLRVVDAGGTGIPNVTAAMVDQFGAAVFSVVTDAQGDIAEQTVTYGICVNPNGGGIGTWTTYSPHTLTISLAGYTTRAIVYTMDRAREEIEELLPKGLRKDIEGNLYMEINSVGDLLRTDDPVGAP